MPTGIDTMETEAPVLVGEQSQTEISEDTSGADAVLHVGEKAVDTVPQGSPSSKDALPTDASADSAVLRPTPAPSEPETVGKRTIETLATQELTVNPIKKSLPKSTPEPEETAEADNVHLFASHTDSPFPWESPVSLSASQKGANPIESMLQSKGIKALDAYLKSHAPRGGERSLELVRIDGKPMGGAVQTHFWFTPTLFILFVLYAFTIASRKKALGKKVRNLFSPTSSGERSVITPIEEFQEQLPLLVLSCANIAWLAFFCVNTFLHTTEMPFVAWATSAIVVGVALALRLLLTQSVCYVFFDEETFQKIERTSLLTFSLTGVALIPSVLLLAYASAIFTPFAIYWGVAVCALLFLLYLLRVVPFFFKGTFSIFYLILYLCTVEFLPVIALVVGLEQIN